MMRAHIFVVIYGLFIAKYAFAAPATNTNVEDINALYVEQLLSNLNTSVDPCEDFYAYACGNWAQNYDAAAYVDVPGYMDHKVNKQLLSALLAAKAKLTENGVIQQAWRYYESCVNLEAPALNSFLRYVQQALHLEWPIFRADWQQPWRNATQFDWLRVIGGLRAYALNGVFITQHVNVRLTNGSHYLLELHAQQPVTAATWSLALRYKDIEDIFINFGLTLEEAHNVSTAVIALEQAMDNASGAFALLNANTLNASDTNVTRANLTSFEMNIADLTELVPQIDWRKYLENALGQVVNLERTLVQTYSYDLIYFRQLPALLAAHSNETIAYYIMLKFMYQLSADLPAVVPGADKSNHCVRLLRGYMPLAANYLYEEYYYKQRRVASDAALQRMFNKLRANFAQIVATNTMQLNSTARAYILDELAGMQLRVGNVPHAAQNLTRLVEEYYADVRMNGSDFYVNHIQLIRSNVRRSQAKLLNLPRTSNASQQLIYEHDFETASSSSPVKIFDNVVLVPYGYLQLPLYEHRLDALLQYSLFGFILAHEIMHAYDLFHIIYDQHGNFNALGLDVAEHYWDFINCTRQRQLNDVLSENMADVAGLRLAYQTYFGVTESSAVAKESNNITKDDVAAEPRPSSAGHVGNVASTTSQLPAMDNNEIPDNFTNTSPSAASSPLLPHGNFTRPQLFFINSVQFLCANMPRIQALDVQAVHLGHDMHDVRVRRNWANLEHFAVAF
ncbi:neprilysin-1-like [Anastrepha ludens]|uniref:neprilysin-1-like n=1 Tax=Anastrepha ludens TaxID=28586 RepID=UPI0023B2048C|nr:neprilysin-1-like [Anastrepha ludens]